MLWQSFGKICDLPKDINEIFDGCWTFVGGLGLSLTQWQQALKSSRIWILSGHEKSCSPRNQFTGAFFPEVCLMVGWLIIPASQPIFCLRTARTFVKMTLSLSSLNRNVGHGLCDHSILEYALPRVTKIWLMTTLRFQFYWNCRKASDFWSLFSTLCCAISYLKYENTLELWGGRGGIGAKCERILRFQVRRKRGEREGCEVTWYRSFIYSILECLPYLPKIVLSPPLCLLIH